MRVIATFGLLGFLAGCYTGAPGGGADSEKDYTVLTAQEWAGDLSRTGMEAIRRYRPSWVTKRFSVFVRGEESPDTRGILNSWTVDMFTEMRFYEGVECRDRFGGLYDSVVEVTLRE